MNEFNMQRKSYSHIVIFNYGIPMKFQKSNFTLMVMCMVLSCLVEPGRGPLG